MIFVCELMQILSLTVSLFWLRAGSIQGINGKIKMFFEKYLHYTGEYQKCVTFICMVKRFQISVDTGTDYQTNSFYEYYSRGFPFFFFSLHQISLRVCMSQ